MSGAFVQQIFDPLVQLAFWGVRFSPIIVAEVLTMSITATSGTQSASQGLWQRLSLQQTQRAAREAELNARSLQSQAGDARAAASRAQDNARALEVKASQAQATASQAAHNLVVAQSSGQFQTQVSTLDSRISSSVQSSQASQAQAPVVNSQGQTIGTVVNVTA